MKKLLLLSQLLVFALSLLLANNGERATAELKCRNYRQPDFESTKCKPGQQICCDEESGTD